MMHQHPRSGVSAMPVTAASHMIAFCRLPFRLPPQPHVRVDERVDSLPHLCHGGRIPQAVSRCWIYRETGWTIQCRAEPNLIKVMGRLRRERLTSNLDFSDSHLHG